MGQTEEYLLNFSCVALLYFCGIMPLLPKRRYKRKVDLKGQPAAHTYYAVQVCDATKVSFMFFCLANKYSSITNR